MNFNGNNLHISLRLTGEILILKNLFIKRKKTRGEPPGTEIGAGIGRSGETNSQNIFRCATKWPVMNNFGLLKRIFLRVDAIMKLWQKANRCAIGA